MIRRLGKLTGFIALIWFITKCQQKCINLWKNNAEKNRAKLILMNQWVNIKQEGKKLESFFLKNGYKKIALYGMGEVGERLVKELKDSEIEIAYGIDRNAQQIYSQIDLLTMEDNLPQVDAIVITAVGEFDDISRALQVKMECPVLAIEDIVNEI